MWFTGNRANFHDFRDERFTISYCNKWLKRSCRLVGFEACSSNFRKSRRLLSTPKIVNRKECLFFAVISTSSTNSCLQKRADIFFPERFLDRRLKSAFESFDLSFFLAAAMRTFDVITGWQRRSNVHPLISRIMTSTLYSTSLSNVRYFCWIMHKFSSQFYNLIVKNQLWVFISHCV